MATFQCLIEATKGNETRYYHATVEEDGFVYFNDRTFYRVETPQNLIQDLENDQTVTITSGIQYWYVVRDIWVYANRFDQLELSMPPEIDVQALQNAMDTVVDYINDLGNKAIGNNGDELFNLWQDVYNIASDLNTQNISVRYPSGISVYNRWTNKQNVPVQ